MVGVVFIRLPLRGRLLVGVILIRLPLRGVRRPERAAVRRFQPNARSVDEGHIMIFPKEKSIRLFFKTKGAENSSADFSLFYPSSVAFGATFPRGEGFWLASSSSGFPWEGRLLARVILVRFSSKGRLLARVILIGLPAWNDQCSTHESTPCFTKNCRLLIQKSLPLPECELPDEPE